MIYKTLLLLAVSLSVQAADVPDNFCDDPEKAVNNENLAKKHPADERIIKLVALRTGLCDLLKKNIITNEFAIDLFETERQREVIKRLQEEIKPDISL